MLVEPARFYHPFGGRATPFSNSSKQASTARKMAENSELYPNGSNPSEILWNDYEYEVQSYKV